VLNFESTGLSGLFSINVKQQLSTIAFDSISMNFCLLCWKSQGISCALESGYLDFCPLNESVTEEALQKTGA